MKQRIAAIDYGEKRIGIALSDSNGRIALPLTTVEGGKKAILSIIKALDVYKEEICLVLIGLPLLLNGKEGDLAQKVRLFAKELKSITSWPITFIDERLSSVEADKRLRELSCNRKKRSSKIDMTAATLLLQQYLENCT